MIDPTVGRDHEVGAEPGGRGLHENVASASGAGAARRVADHPASGVARRDRDQCLTRLKRDVGHPLGSGVEAVDGPVPRGLNFGSGGEPPTLPGYGGSGAL
jgi:hypothetical protein